MEVKKKLIVGALSAVLGLSLVGGGTWAAFNDIEESNAKVEAGTLNLSVNPSIVFDLEKLKPGDTMQRTFELSNIGSLNIEKVLMHTSYKVYNKYGAQVSEEEFSRGFANQFEILLLTTDGARIGDGIGKTLAEIKELTDAKKSIDLTTYIKLISPEEDLPVGDTDKIVMKIIFKNDLTRYSETDRKFKQNIYQGYKMKLQFDLEATQYNNGIVQPKK